MEEKIFGFMEKMYSDLTKRLDNIEKKIDDKADKTDIVRLENSLNPKIEALFYRYKQNADILERVEMGVSKQEEIIMRQVRL
jgi:SPX domain protein involved in polyphosphate accumulation